MSTDPKYTEMQLSALQEIANIGTGRAATSLSEMVGKPVDITVPMLDVVPMADVTVRLGSQEALVYGVLTPIKGEVPAAVLLVFQQAAAQALTGLFGVEAESAMGHSALQEMGNILTAAYARATGELCGFSIEPDTPLLAIDMLAAVVSSALAMTVNAADEVLFLETTLGIEDVECAFGFLFLPEAESVALLLGGLGLA